MSVALDDIFPAHLSAGTATGEGPPSRAVAGFRKPETPNLG
jgi:hypothetical protein